MDGSHVRNIELARLCCERADRFVGSQSLSLSHLFLLGRIWLRLNRVPSITLDVGNDWEAELIRGSLDRRSFGFRTALHRAASVLAIDAGSNSLQGSRFSTLRRMDRKAARIGITCRAVLSHEREHLLDQAIRFETENPDARYRRESPNSHGLRQTSLWLAAFSSDGVPLALSVTPTSGDVALLRYMRTLQPPPEASLARYALTAELVRTLSEMQVRHLIDSVSPLALPCTLRHFATMVGFRIMRASIASSR